MDIEDEIDVLETVLSNLETAREEVQDAPYHSYLAETWGHDVEEIKARLEELYTMQNEQWKKELEYQNFEYERSVL